MSHSKAITPKKTALAKREIAGLSEPDNHSLLSLAVCAVGLIAQTRQFPDGTRVTGVFGLVGVEDLCNAPVTARCQWMVKGHLVPYYWMACDNPDHRKDAGIIWHYDKRGNLVRIERIRPLNEGPSSTLITQPKRLYKACGICFGRGVKKEKSRWVHCPCGRLVDSRGAALLAKQKKLDAQYQELKRKGW